MNNKANGIFEGIGSKELVIVSGSMLAAYLVLAGIGGAEGCGLEQAIKARKGGIVGSTPNGASTIVNLPAQGAVTFPAMPSYDLAGFLGYPTPTPAPITTAPERAAIERAHEKVVSSGFAPATTFTGTPTTPAFVQKDIYHKAMLSELGLTTKKGTSLPTGAAPVVSALQTGFVSRSTGSGVRSTYTKTAAKAPAAKAKAPTTKKKIVSTISRSSISRFTGTPSSRTGD